MKTIHKISLIIMVALIMFGIGIGRSYAAEKVQVLIGTAAIGAAYYPVGVAMAEVINKHLPGYSAICQVTGGSVANLRLIDNKQITIGFSAADFGAAALKGEKPYDKLLNVLPIMHLGYFPHQFVTLKKTNIKTVYDCKGKRIAIGTPGASINVNARLILKLHGIGENEFKPFYMGYSESGDALGDGVIDVLIDPGVMPSPTTESLFLFAVMWSWLQEIQWLLKKLILLDLWYIKFQKGCIKVLIMMYIIMQDGV